MMTNVLIATLIYLYFRLGGNNDDRYIILMSQCVFMSGAKIKDDDFFRGEAISWINWEEVYQLYHQDALDVSMVGLWVL